MLALELIDRVRSVSPGVANRLISAALPTIIPFAGGLGMKVEEVSEWRAIAAVPLKRRNRNHVGSIYFGAQMTLAELTMGLLLFNLFPPGPFGVLVKRVEADFHTKAKTAVRAVCEPDRDELQALKDAVAGAEAKGDMWFAVKLLDAEAKIVTEARFLATVKRFQR